MRDLRVLIILALVLALVVFDYSGAYLVGHNSVVEIRQFDLILIFINVTAVYLMITLIGMSFYTRLRKQLNERNSENRELVKKNEMASQMQTMLTSLLEDLKSERSYADQLARENQNLASIVQQSKEPTILLDVQLRPVAVNESARKLFDFGEQLLDTDFIQLFSSGQRSEISRVVNTLLKGDSDEKVELSMEVGADDPATYELRFALLRDSYSRPTSIAVNFRNLTEKSREQEQLQLVIEQAPTALILVGEDGVIRVANTQAESLFLYGEGELVGLNVDELAPTGIRKEHPHLRAQFFREPKARAMGAGRDLSGRRKDGSEIPVEIGLNPIVTTEGNYVVASIVDISERKNAQLEMEKMNEQLQQKNKEMEQFIYTVSHDLKSPLVTIGGFANALKSELLSELNEKQLHKFDRILNNVERMGSLLRDLLEISRIIRQDLEFTYLDIREVTTSILQSMESELQDSGAKIEFDEPLAVLFANERMVLQCLQNILSNAIKYRSRERPLVIKISCVSTKMETTLAVEDNGIGIDPKYHSRIFRIFERLDIGEGAGVGLAIVKTVMEKHMGNVSLESVDGSGSKFCLHFPRL